MQSAVGVLEPQAGFISIDAKNLKQFDPQSYRHHLAFCPAQPDILGESIAENMRFVKPEATDNEIKQALIEAGGQSLLDSINDDIYQPVFTHGDLVHNSAEASHISLARALLKSSKLLILDEPIANQDPQAKAQFIATLTKLKGNATVIFSSHDSELINLADKVIVLDKGTVAFAGPLPTKDEGSSDPSINSQAQDSKGANHE